MIINMSKIPNENKKVKISSIEIVGMKNYHN